MNYHQLCGETLDIILGVLSTIKPLSLMKEPLDCVNAFSNFISSQIEETEYQIDTENKAKNVVCILDYFFFLFLWHLLE